MAGPLSPGLPVLIASPHLSRLLFLAVACLAAAAGVLHFLQECLVYSRGHLVDLPLYTDAAIRYWQGQPIHLRADDMAWQYKPGAIVFKFPPPYLLLWLPWFDASGVWPSHFQAGFITVAALLYFSGLAVSLRLVWQAAQATPAGLLASGSVFWLFAGVAVLAASWFVPILYVMGATSAENLMLCLAVAALASLSRWPWLAGLLLAFIACLKLYPAFLLLYPLATRQWRLVWATLVGFVVVVAVSLAVFGLEAHRFYLTQILPLLLSEPIADDWTEPFLHTTGNLSLVKVMTGYSLLFPSKDALWLNVVRLPMVAMAGWLLWRAAAAATAPGSWVALRGWGLCITTMLACLPNLYYPYFTWLLFPGLVLAAWALHRGKVAWLLCVLAVLAPLWVNDTWVMGLVRAHGLDQPGPDIVAAVEASGVWAFLWHQHPLLGGLMAAGRAVPFTLYALWLGLAWSLYRER